ncbi:MAG: 1-acyl-sn-glycerol-3-phosphate acyltransferase [Treponemataceae bacterium]|nr:1-acyl-sn-glycerol-3-phosphate acyltransferase [Treponemataceae bacterium]
MTLTIALLKTAIYLLKHQKEKRHCFRLEKEGKIAERDALVEKHVPAWATYMIDMVGNKQNVINVKGKENIPQDGSVVFVANHQSYLDIPLLISTSKKPVGFIAKYEILKIPLLSDWMKLMQCVFLKRQSPRQSVQAMSKAVETIKKGYSLVIFPEGHRSKCNEIKAFHPGSFKLAFRSEVPIIPVTIDGSYHLYEENKKPMPGNVNITFHPAVATAGLTKEEQNGVIDKVFEVIKAELPQATL